MSRSTWVSGPERLAPFAYESVTLYGWPFQADSAKRKFCNFPAVPYDRPTQSHDPGDTTRTGFNVSTGLGLNVPRSLAATEGIAIAFFSSGY